MSARSPYWCAMLCAETRDEIAERMNEVLGDRWFTLVFCNSYDENSDRFTSVGVYPSQYLTAPVENYRDPCVLGLSFNVPRFAMGVSTTAQTQNEGRVARPHGYVRVDFNGTEITIDHYAPAGYRLRWIFAVERHDIEMAGAPGARP